MAGGERERELQRQLAQAALQAEAALESQAAALASDNETTVQRLLQQRDTANAALNVRTVQRGPTMGVCEAKLCTTGRVGQGQLCCALLSCMTVPHSSLQGSFVRSWVQTCMDLSTVSLVHLSAHH